MEREERDPGSRFRLVHFVMPRLWFVKFKQIRRSYSRKRRPVSVKGEACFSTDQSASFHSCRISFDEQTQLQKIGSVRNSFNFGQTGDWQQGGGGVAGARIDAVFPLSPKIAGVVPSVDVKFAMSPLRHSMSPSPSSRFCPSPRRYPVSSATSLVKGVDIPYPLSPRKTASPARSLRLAEPGLDVFYPPASPARFHFAPSISSRPLQRSKSDSRSVRSSLLACFTDDYRPLSSKLATSPCTSPQRQGGGEVSAVPLRKSASAREGWTSGAVRWSVEEVERNRKSASVSCTCSPGSGYCQACATRAGACGSGNRGIGAALRKNGKSKGGVESRHGAQQRRGMSLSCISYATNSPESVHVSLCSPVSEPLVLEDGSGEERRESAAKQEHNWERENSWSVLAEVDNQVVRKQVVLRKRLHRETHSRSKSFHSLSSPAERGSQGALQDALADVDYSCSFRLSTSSGDVNALEQGTLPWEKDFSSATSEAESLFTSFEVDSACVTPAKPLPYSSGFLYSRGHLKHNAFCRGAEGRSEHRSWPASLIPEEEAEFAPLSPETDVSGRAQVLSDGNDAWEGKMTGSFNSRVTSPTDSAVSGCVQHQNEWRGAHRPASVAAGQLEMKSQLESHRYERTDESLAASSGSGSGSLEDSSAQELVDQIMSAGSGRRWEQWVQQKRDVAGACSEEDVQVRPGHGWNDHLLSLQRRGTLSSDDDLGVLNELDCNEVRHVVSEESLASSEGEQGYHEAQSVLSVRPARRQVVFAKRKASQGRRCGDFQGKLRLGNSASDRKPLLRTMRSKVQRRREATPCPAVDIPADIQGKVRESVPVVTRSYDPYNDFRDSMVGMIVEKEIVDAQDLEELLHAYLALNTWEYHELIVEVFTDLWHQIFETEK